MLEQQEEPSSYLVWIEDSRGARLWAQNYTVTSTLTYGQSPWQH